MGAPITTTSINIVEASQNEATLVILFLVAHRFLRHKQVARSTRFKLNCYASSCSLSRVFPGEASEAVVIRIRSRVGVT